MGQYRMTNHLTIRMAWHDNKWDGKICRHPEENVYCVGSHSLLSERLARERKLDFEDESKKIDSLLPEYIPPCFWSSNAFSNDSANVVHAHPFKKYRDKINRIEGIHIKPELRSWPGFKVSILNKRKNLDLFKEANIWVKNELSTLRGEE